MAKNNIDKLLAEKHKYDFCIFQCKTGETHRAKTGIMGIADCLVMKKSWTNPKVIIYEKKISRGDYFNEIRSKKYEKYLPYCNEFGYIVPRGLITVDELPSKDFGLYYCGNNTIYTKNKAKYFDKEIPNTLFQYILMNKVNNDVYPFSTDRADLIENYLKQKNYNYEIGRQLSRNISKELNFTHDLKIKLLKCNDKNILDFFRINFPYSELVEILESHNKFNLFSNGDTVHTN